MDNKKTKFQNKVGKAKIGNIENAYISISARLNTDGELIKNMSFFYVCDDGSTIVEWEPRFGPITRIESCDRDHPQAEEHWWFDFCTGYGNWSQLAVDENNLKEYFINGDYETIFSVLKTFA